MNIADYLKLAQQAANKLSPEGDGQKDSPRVSALKNVAKTAMAAGEFAFACDVMATVPRDPREATFYLTLLARSGRIDEAIQEAQKQDNPPWGVLALMIAQKDLHKGLEIIDRLPAKYRSPFPEFNIGTPSQVNNPQSRC